MPRVLKFGYSSSHLFADPTCWINAKLWNDPSEASCRFLHLLLWSFYGLRFTPRCVQFDRLHAELLILHLKCSVQYSICFFLAAEASRRL